MATKKSKTTKTSSSSKSMDTNNMLVSVVVGIVLFGLGYVVGKTKAAFRYESMYQSKMNQYRNEMMQDRDYFNQTLDNAMTREDLRNVIIKRVDDYEMQLKKNMMRR